VLLTRTKLRDHSTAYRFVSQSRAYRPPELLSLRGLHFLICPWHQLPACLSDGVDRRVPFARPLTNRSNSSGSRRPSPSTCDDVRLPSALTSDWTAVATHFAPRSRFQREVHKAGPELRAEARAIPLLRFS
jgi:hypothetical protein